MLQGKTQKSSLSFYMSVASTNVQTTEESSGVVVIQGCLFSLCQVDGPYSRTELTVQSCWRSVKEGWFFIMEQSSPISFLWTYRLRSQPCITHQHCREVDRCLQEQLRRHPSHLSTRVYLLSEVWISINPKRGFDDVPFTSTRTKLEVLNMGLSWSIPEPFESYRLRTFKSLNWAGKTSQTSL